MNKDRRERLRDVQSQIDEAVSSIYDIQDEEQNAFDSMPEGLQGTERGEHMLNAISEMEEIVGDLETVKQRIENFSY